MIDIIKQLQERNPALGAYILVLRPDSRALADPEHLTLEAQTWMGIRTPGARLSRDLGAAGHDLPVFRDDC